VSDRLHGLQKSKIWKNFVFLFITFVLGGCSNLPLLRQVFQPAAEATSVGMLFEDDFSEKTSGWDHFASDVGWTDYQQQAYHIVVNEPITDLFANPYQSFKDVVIEVTAVKKDGSDSNSYGVMCRYQDEENFYAALISSDGYAGIFLRKDGRYTQLGQAEMQAVPAILGGKAANRIHFECIGDTLALAVNGSPVDAQQDGSFESGDVGLIAGTFEEGGVHIAFDDFKVWQP